MSFFAELKRRNVIRVAVAYLVAAWVVLQIVDVVFPIMNIPGWVSQALLVLVSIGFVIAVIIAWAYEMTPEGLKRDNKVDRSQSIAHHTAKKLDVITIGLLIVVGGFVLYDRFSPKTIVDDQVAVQKPSDLPAGQPVSVKAAETGLDDRPSVAVLPFVNMSDDTQNEYFSDGISEELLNVLVKIDGLRVPSRTSSFTFKGSDKKISEIGQELGVDHVLEGSVRKAGTQIRVTAQLIDVRTDTHLWSDTYTRELDDIFALQDEISGAIVDALKLTLSVDNKAALTEHATENADALNQYLIGRHLWNRRNFTDLNESVYHFKKAIELDPGFEKAWAALADVYALIPQYGPANTAEYIELAIQAANRALELNPDSAQALTVSAYIKGTSLYQWEEADRLFRRAIEIDPNYSTARMWYAEQLMILNKLDEALDQLTLAAQSDPMRAVIPHVMGWAHIYSDRWLEAKPYLQRALIFDPGLPFAHSNIGIYEVFSGNWDAGRKGWSTYYDLINAPQDERYEIDVVNALENPELHQIAVDKILAYPKYDGAMGNALPLMMLGEHELAIENLLRSFEQGDPYAAHMNRVVSYEPIRNDPRFQELIRKMNLQDYPLR
jgi:TolB-like protein